MLQRTPGYFPDRRRERVQIWGTESVRASQDADVTARNRRSAKSTEKISGRRLHAVPGQVVVAVELSSRQHCATEQKKIPCRLFCPTKPKLSQPSRERIRTPAVTEKSGTGLFSMFVSCSKFAPAAGMPNERKKKHSAGCREQEVACPPVREMWERAEQDIWTMAVWHSAKAQSKATAEADHESIPHSRKRI